MNFTEAIKEFDKGSHMTRTSWENKDWTLVLEGELLFGYGDSDRTYYEDKIITEFVFEDYKATDWEVVKKGDKEWNLSKDGNISYNGLMDIKKCRDLILEDISDWDGGDHITMEFVNKRFGDL